MSPQGRTLPLVNDIIWIQCRSPHFVACIITFECYFLYWMNARADSNVPIFARADSNNAWFAEAGEVTVRNLSCVDIAYAVKLSCSWHLPNTSIRPVPLKIGERYVKCCSPEGNFRTSAICTVVGEAFLEILTQLLGAGDEGCSSFNGIISMSFHSSTLSLSPSLAPLPCRVHEKLLQMFCPKSPLAWLMSDIGPLLLYWLRQPPEKR